MRALLVTLGTTGDIYPMIGLGKAIKQHGGAVTIATSEYFRAEIEAAGMGFIALAPHWTQEEFVDLAKQLNRNTNPAVELRWIFQSFKPALPENLRLLEAAAQNHDIMVASYLLPFLSGIADRVGLPFAITAFCHSAVPSPDQVMRGYPELRWLPRPLRRVYNRFFWYAADKAVDALLNHTIGAELKAAKIPKINRFFCQPARLVLATVSPGLMQPGGVTFDSRFVFSGYIRHQPPEDPALQQRLDSFCGSKKVPVINFGSMVRDSSQKQFQRFLKNWPKGRKLIVQAGWAGLAVPTDRPEILGLGKTNHDVLFGYASVVVHHGGAGTTGSVLHAGVPHLVVPHIADQFFWASEVVRLGVGHTISCKRWERNALGAIDAVLGDHSCSEKAREAAAVLATENGGESSVRLLREFMEREKMRPGGTPTAGPDA